jgi:glutamate formiminotransferase/formiminotetrahydrofolate cyclodeaminase
MNAFSLPKSNAEEKKIRDKAIESATKYATEVPFKVMQLSYESMEVIRAMAEQGNPNSVSDAGVGVLCARTAVMGAYLNVRINAKGLMDKPFARSILQKGKRIVENTKKQEAKILSIVGKKI